MRLALAIAAILVAASLCPAQTFRTRNGTQVGTGVIPEDETATREEMRKRYDQETAAARAALEKRAWAAAMVAIDNAVINATSQAQVDALRPMVQQIQDEGQRQYEAARKLYDDKQYLQALKECERISATFGRLPAGQAARKTIKDAQDDPDCRGALQEFKAGALETAIENAIAQAERPTSRPTIASRPATQPVSQPATLPGRVTRIRKLPAEQASHVMEMLDTLAKVYPDSQRGQKAKADLDELNSDPAFAAAIAKQRAGQEPKKLWSVAEAYRAANQNARALERYQELIAKYPDSDEAKKAATIIGHLK